MSDSGINERLARIEGCVEVISRGQEKILDSVEKLKDKVELQTRTYAAEDNNRDQRIARNESKLSFLFKISWFILFAFLGAAVKVFLV